MDQTWLNVLPSELHKLSSEYLKPRYEYKTETIDYIDINNEKSIIFNEHLIIHVSDVEIPLLFSYRIVTRRTNNKPGMMLFSIDSEMDSCLQMNLSGDWSNQQLEWNFEKKEFTYHNLVLKGIHVPEIIKWLRYIDDKLKDKYIEIF